MKNNTLITEYRGKTIVVWLCDHLSIKFWNGYVSLNSSLYNSDSLSDSYDSQCFKDIKVHGGFTYMGKLNRIIENSKLTFIGFDTDQLHDIDYPKSKAFVLHECQLVADQLIERNL